MDKVTEVVGKADLAFGLRPALEKFQFSQDEELFITFEYEDKVFKTGAIPPASKEIKSTFDSENLKDTVIDWLNKTEKEYNLGTVLCDEMGLSKEGNFEFTIKLGSQSNEFVLQRVGLRCPCHPGVTFCCWG